MIDSYIYIIDDLVFFCTGLLLLYLFVMAIASHFKHITYSWQKVISEHELIASHKTKEPLKQGNMSMGVYECSYQELESIEAKILALVEQIPRIRKNNR